MTSYVLGCNIHPCTIQFPYPFRNNRDSTKAVGSNYLCAYKLTPPHTHTSFRKTGDSMPKSPNSLPPFYWFHFNLRGKHNINNFCYLITYVVSTMPCTFHGMCSLILTTAQETYTAFLIYLGRERLREVMQSIQISCLISCMVSVWTQAVRLRGHTRTYSILTPCLLSIL